MSTFSVRDAAEGDEPALAGIFRRASLSNAGDRGVLLAHPDALTLPDDVLASGRTRVATKTDGAVVGFARTQPTERGVLELEDLFVDPNAMGRGVARQLLLPILAQAASGAVVPLAGPAHHPPPGL